MMIESTNRVRAREEKILVRNQTSRWTVVSLNLVSPDTATIRPITVLSPDGKHNACATALDDKGGHQREVACLEGIVGSGVYRAGDHITDISTSVAIDAMNRECKYLSPVSKLRSNRTSLEASTILISAGTRFSDRKHNDVANDDICSRDGVPVPIPYHDCILGNEGLDRVHDPRGMPVNPCVKRRRDHDHQELRMT